MRFSPIFVYVASPFLSACCASADLSSQGGIAIAIICLCQTIVFENKFSDIVSQTQTIFDCTAFCLVCSRLLPPLERVIGISFYLFAMSPEVGDNREILAYFYLCCKPFPFNLLTQQAFALLLRSLVANVVEKFSVFRFPFSVFYYLCTQWHNFSGNICYSRSWWRLWGWRGLSTTSPLR